MIRVDAVRYIFSDKLGREIGWKLHYGIKIGDTIYDNLTLDGMDFTEWKIDLGIGRFHDIKWNIVDELTPYLK